MRILHLLDKRLPDIRVEREARSAAMAGHKVFIVCEDAREYALDRCYFARCYKVRWTRAARLGLPPATRKLLVSLKEVIDEADPDVIHAHDVFAAGIALLLERPVVFDDREYLSNRFKVQLRAFIRSARHFVRIPSRLLSLIRASRIEKLLAERAPVLTVSRTIAEEYARRGAQVYDLPNLPCEPEVKLLHQGTPDTYDVLRLVFIGSDADLLKPVPYRDARPFVRLLRRYFPDAELHVYGTSIRKTEPKQGVIFHGRVPHLELLRRLGRYHVGVVPWKPQAYHRYLSTNKIFLYLHAGLACILPSTMKGALDYISDVPGVLTFRELNEVVRLLRRLNLRELYNMRDQIRRITLSRLTWERWAGVLFKAYKASLELFEKSEN